MNGQNDCEIKRVVVKVGTSTLTHASGKLHIRRVEKLVSALVDAHNQGIECILVSSGAIGIGMSRLNLPHRGKTLSEKQALAAVGQGLLMHIYEKKFAEYGTLAAQILLTKDDLAHRMRFLNARNTILELFHFGVIPVINENDTVSVEEIRFGDNDTLAALVGVLTSADLVILLTDIDGLYTANPAENKDAVKLDVVDEISAEIEAMAGQAGSNVGTGGMITKLEAAKIATSAGIPLVIADGSEPYVIQKIIDGQTLGTHFTARDCHYHSRKSWIVYGSESVGRIVIDDGAVDALTHRGKSLLPKGVLGIKGHFFAGDVVDISDKHGKIIAKGISNYNDTDVEKIKGLHTDQLSNVLKEGVYDVVVHRDNMGLKT